MDWIELVDAAWKAREHAYAPYSQFFVGAALGNLLAPGLGVPVDFLAAIGFVAVFAGATHTPWACTVMAAELFGGESIFYFQIQHFLLQ